MELPSQIVRQAAEMANYDREVEAQNALLTSPPAPQPVPPVTPTAEVTAPVAPVEPPRVEAPKSDEATWQQRFLTLQGKYNGEVPRLHSEIKRLKTELESAAARIETLTKVQLIPEGTNTSKRVTDKDTETFGSDLLDLIERKARDVVSEREQAQEVELNKVKVENEDLRKRLNGVTERQGVTDKATYFGELTRLVPEFEAMNVDPGFLAWLAEADALTGIVRQAVLNDAFEALDAQRTANVFLTYKRTAKAPEPTPPQPAPQINPEIQRQVAPGRSKDPATTTPSPTDKSAQILSATEIDAFYREVNQGKYRGKEAEQARIEAEIDLAVAQGRVR